MKKPKSQSNHRDEIPGELYTIATELRGLGELFNMSSGQPPLSEAAHHGISSLLLAFAASLEDVREAIEYR